MKLTLKSITLFVGIICFHIPAIASINPHTFIDSRAQEMVDVIVNNHALFATDPELFKAKINIIFEPMVDFKRVGASVMGKKFYLASTKRQREKFISRFRESLLDTYSSTLAQWGDQKIETIFPESRIPNQTEEVHQNLLTSNNIYPIVYKVRNDGSGNWLIINIIVNGVNLGLTFRNQFQSLALEHDGDIEEIINHWISDVDL